MLANKISNRFGLNKFINPTEDLGKIALFDTSVASLNVGDEIINDAAKKQIATIFQQEQFIRFTTHDGISNIGINRANLAKYRIVCGTNILRSNLFFANQWNFSPLDFLKLKQLTLLGVGWANYQKKPSFYSSMVLQNILDKDIKHSVRDSYTEKMLQSIGVKNIINTACPTMWNLTPEHCGNIEKEKSENVIFTITDYRPDLKWDSEFISKLKKLYKKIYFWVQGAGDLSYFNKLPKEITTDIIVVPPQLEAYDFVLSKESSLDFVGTRLHAAIRALQFSRRVVVIGVDNRAIEKGKDFNLHVVPREDGVNAVIRSVKGFGSTDIRLDEQSIANWKEQFQS